MDSTLLIAMMGGSISFASTAVGACLALTPRSQKWLQSHASSIDFVLGLMLSAAAFSLVGPVALKALYHWEKLEIIVFGLYAGIFLVTLLRRLIQQRMHFSSQAQANQLLLAIVLMVHNIPEGMASGVSLIGLSKESALSLLGAIALQNIPEGLLMVVSLRSLGMPLGYAFLGGIGSGVVEFLGSFAAGLAIDTTQEYVPAVLAMAGGAMFTSALVELFESGSLRERLWNMRFAAGILSVPLLNQLIF